MRDRWQPVHATPDEMEYTWQHDPRWKGIQRPYTPEDVVRLRGNVFVEHSIARRGAEALWNLLQVEGHVAALGAMTGAQAVQMVKAGLQSIYVSGWQVAADNNLAGHTYPDQSLYPANSVPNLVRRINNALLRADQIHHLDGGVLRDWMVPIVADGEAGFGGPLNAHELTKAMIEAGAAGVHYEDQLASAKKCGHMGGKVLVPASQQQCALVAARLAADVLDVPTVLVARTDARSATLLSADTDALDAPYLTGKRTIEGHHVVRAGMDAAIARALAYAPHADVLWFETNEPNLDEAQQLAREVHRQYPGKILAYNCSPSFHWRKHLDSETIADFQKRLAAMGYKYQFVTLAGFHALCASTFALAKRYQREGMTAYVALQDQEFQLADEGYSAVRHQQEVGTTYFDAVARAIVGGDASTLAQEGSTEATQFQEPVPMPMALVPTKSASRKSKSKDNS